MAGSTTSRLGPLAAPPPQPADQRAPGRLGLGHDRLGGGRGEQGQRPHPRLHRGGAAPQRRAARQPDLVDAAAPPGGGARQATRGEAGRQRRAERQRHAGAERLAPGGQGLVGQAAPADADGARRGQGQAAAQLQHLGGGEGGLARGARPVQRQRRPQQRAVRAVLGRPGRQQRLGIGQAPGRVAGRQQAAHRLERGGGRHRAEQREGQRAERGRRGPGQRAPGARLGRAARRRLQHRPGGRRDVAAGEPAEERQAGQGHLVEAEPPGVGGAPAEAHPGGGQRAAGQLGARLDPALVGRLEAGRQQHHRLRPLGPELEEHRLDQRRGPLGLEGRGQAEVARQGAPAAPVGEAGHPGRVLAEAGPVEAGVEHDRQEAGRPDGLRRRQPRQGAGPPAQQRLQAAPVRRGARGGPPPRGGRGAAGRAELRAGHQLER